jgi:hypothetical protein
MDLQGEIRGVVVNVQIPIEDVESTSVLDFLLQVVEVLQMSLL